MDLRAAAIEAARRNNLDPDLFLRLIQQESGFQPHVTSSAGAYGPAQLMPGTAADLGVDPRDPLQNLEGGARYLRQQMDTFGDPRLALAAYNAGPGAVQKYGGVPPYEETQNYVASILGGQGGGNVTRSSKGTTGMGLLDMPAQQPQTFGQKIGEGFRSGELFDQLALAFNSLRMNPDQNLATTVQARQERRGQEQATNRTAEWLRSRGHDDLAAALETGSIDAGSTVNEALARERPADPMDALNMQIKQLELQNLQNPQPGFRRATPEEASAYGAQGGQFGPDNRFYAEEGGQPESQTERDIALLGEIGVPRDEAIRITQLYVVSRDPVTGEQVLINKATGKSVGAVPQQLTGQPPAATTPAAATDEFGQPFPDATTAFGVSGAARNAANIAGDVTGLGTPFPETQRTMADFQVLQETLINDIASAYDRQPPSWLLQNIRGLTPEAGSVFTGPDAAVAKLEALGRNLQTELSNTEAQLNERLSPADREVLRKRRVGLNAGLQRIRTARNALAPQAKPVTIRPEVEDRLKVYD